MKNRYEKPEVKQIEFDLIDVLTQSEEPAPTTGGSGMSDNDNGGNSSGDYNF